MANWIQGAVRHKGSFTRKAKAAGMSVGKFAQKKESAGGVLGKQARLAITLRKLGKRKK